MGIMWRSTISTPLTMEFAKPNWLNFTPKTSLDTHYLPRYAISQFPLECIMVNVLLHWCCEARINLRCKLGCEVVIQLFLKRVYHFALSLFETQESYPQKGHLRDILKFLGNAPARIQSQRFSASTNSGVPNWLKNHYPISYLSGCNRT